MHEVVQAFTIEQSAFYEQEPPERSHFVGHGFRPALSAHGNNDEHDNFQPPHME
jgi:hypothetical protein